MRLSQIQIELERLYDVDTGIDIRDFLITDRTLAQALYGGRLGTQEALLVRQSPRELAVSLYLDPALLARAESHDPSRMWNLQALNDFWLVLEGISHLLSVAWRAGFDRSTSALELELQAEVDKFVMTAAVLERHHGPSPSTHLQHALFGQTGFLPGLTRPLQQRYRRASRLAASFCASLSERFALRADDRNLLRELRRFYRFDWGRKVDHIATLDC